MVSEVDAKVAAEAAAKEGRQLMKEAFATRDPAKIAARFCEDGSFVNGRGQIPMGDVYKGHKAIEGYFAKLFADTPDVAWTESAEPIFSGNTIVAQWRRTATTKTGDKLDWLGLDIYTFRGNQVLCKDTFIKDVK
ncbi:nuclear transport factor 2 family protein [Aliirhizobium cellulosilyticum]|uniref:Uncharacterized protein (TIGR02246 family) n=1 Tax=Aliirhizobium cellulosilyticum TaxID=393664 RepID=A0A7W6TF61_9HYPH|nr:nuclear transport factor 2 family protein [Rhizobium cellulosilyticum]MBB4349395.1 uncharacterized protein (TIGR02246 family) [Rhizobium cellulosilyticum]MBB4412383.1 uncharacterized protein (TIGR02246 family) [Rhizobium cellulosilyticum]MBB4447015.1 uncharacterized protein (TIGR02246 family) [Rhizobium cellulosilyticum]